MAEAHSIDVPQEVINLFRELERWLRETDRFSLPPHLEKHVEHYVNYKLAMRTVTYPAEEPLFRARIQKPQQESPYPPEAMGAPPAGTATSGRLNPEGISYLYLADSVETAIAEVRPWKGAFVSVGRFHPRRELRLASLTWPTDILDSRTVGDHGEGFVASIMLESLYFSTPTHRDDRLSYLATQYIASKFRHAGVDGLEFSSVLHDAGMNAALFDPSLCTCEQAVTFEVTGVQYDSRRRAA